MALTTLAVPATDQGYASFWSQQKLQQFHDEGFLIQRGLVTHDELAEVRQSIPNALSGDDSKDGLHRERERSGAVRQVYLTHRHCPAFRALAHNPKIVGPVRQVLGTEAYIWHSKINVKDAFEGTVWLWHQDYGYWILDGVEPRLVSVMVLLDRATINNGSLMVVAGSHRWGRMEHYSDTVTTSYKQWCIKTEVLRDRLKEEQIQHVTGEPGDVLFFDSNLVHGSGHNMSPLPRNTFIVVYNASDNRPRAVENPRPDWVVSRDYETVPLLS
jgi:ectoine hydroxylase